MEVSTEVQGDIGRKLTITVPAKRLDASINSRLAQFRKSAKVPGFRKGKVPQSLLDSRFGPQALQEAVDQLINETYPEAAMKEELQVAGLLSIKPAQAKRGKDLIYDVMLEVFPKIKAPSLKGVEIIQPEVKVEDKDIDRTIESIQKRQAEYEPVKRQAKKGDQVTIDFVGTIDGEEFAGGKGEDMQIELGEKRFLEAFEDGLYDMKAGETKTVDVDFPEDYQGKDVAGKTAQFEMSVKQVKAPKLPELNDEFAQAMGVEKGMKALRKEVKSGLKRELEHKRRGYVRDQVMDALAAGQDFDVPKAMVEEEIDRAVVEVKKQMEQQGMPESDEHIKRENFEEQSKRRVKLGLLVREVIEGKKIDVDKDRVKKRAKEMAGNYSDPKAYVDYLMSDQEQFQQLASVVLEEQVLESLLKKADIKEPKQSYEEFMNAQL